jgi:hypothetical protein
MRPIVAQGAGESTPLFCRSTGVGLSEASGTVRGKLKRAGRVLRDRTRVATTYRRPDAAAPTHSLGATSARSAGMTPGPAPVLQPIKTRMSCW